MIGYVAACWGTLSDMTVFIDPPGLERLAWPGAVNAPTAHLRGELSRCVLVGSWACGGGDVHLGAVRACPTIGWEAIGVAS